MESENGRTRTRERPERERQLPEPHETRLPFASEGLEPLRDSHC